MPNINAKVKASVTAICGGKAATSAHIKTADAIFSSVGKVYHIDEDLFPHSELSAGHRARLF